MGVLGTFGYIVFVSVVLILTTSMSNEDLIIDVQSILGRKNQNNNSSHPERVPIARPSPRSIPTSDGTTMGGITAWQVCVTPGCVMRVPERGEGGGGEVGVRGLFQRNVE